MNKGTFIKNSSVYGSFLGLIQDEGDGIVVNNSYFQQNTATSEGGAIADYESMPLNNDIFNYNPGPRVRRLGRARPQGRRLDPRHYAQR